MEPVWKKQLQRTNQCALQKKNPQLHPVCHLLIIIPRAAPRRRGIRNMAAERTQSMEEGERIVQLEATALPNEL